MKRFTRSSQAKAIMNYKKDVPAKINHSFINRRVDAAFISSIAAKKQHHINLGIIARKEVRSVLIIPSKENKTDKESASSNILAKVLKQQGEILIGDKALRYALENSNYIDLAKLWQEKYNLPFVFALLCYHKDKKFYKKVEREFLKKKQKIPMYLLDQASHKTNVTPKEILSYLELISYKLDTKAKLGLKKFYNEAKKI